MRRIVSIAASMALALGALVVTAPTVAATGDCSAGTVMLFRDSNVTGSFRALCWAVSDSDVESEPGNVIGPNSDGNYYNDWDSSSTSSGISSAQYYETPNTNKSICFYTGKNYQGFAGILTSGGSWMNFNGAANNNIASVRFINGTSCPGGPS